jgi:hypothetical protein
MSSLFFIGADRADPMLGENERQGRISNIFFFTTVYCRDTVQSLATRQDGIQPVGFAKEHKLDFWNNF